MKRLIMLHIMFNIVALGTMSVMTSVAESAVSIDGVDSLAHDVIGSAVSTQDIDKVKAELTAQFEAEKQTLVDEYEQKLKALQVRVTPT